MPKGFLITITGHSGSGKSTLVQRLEELYPGQYTEAVSTTSRPVREGEVEGVNYFYVSREAFGKLVEEGALVEHVEFSGNLYGMSKEEIARRTEGGQTATIVVEPNGIPQIRDLYDGPMFCVFLDADENLLVERMSARGDQEEDIRVRVAHDSAHFGSFDVVYDFRIQSGDLDTNVRELHEFIRSRHENLARPATYSDPSARPAQGSGDSNQASA